MNASDKKAIPLFLSISVADKIAPLNPFTLQDLRDNGLKSEVSITSRRLYPLA